MGANISFLLSSSHRSSSGAFSSDAMLLCNLEAEGSPGGEGAFVGTGEPARAGVLGVPS